MPFVPTTVTLHEAGPDAPYKWRMSEPLRWSGRFRGQEKQVEVPTSPVPFTTDLASVPRPLTWLFPRYGQYTKAAILHDYLCQEFRKPPDRPTPQSLLPLSDRSDADELFRDLMAELGVPWLRRFLMWSAVSWGTLFTSLVPGRRSKPIVRWVGRVIVILAVLAAAVLLVARHDVPTIVVCALALPAAILVGGTVALGRTDRAVDGIKMYVTTVIFSPLLATGIVIGLVLYTYLFLEDLTRGLPGLRGFFGDLFSKQAKLEKLGTPQFARLAAVVES